MQQPITSNDIKIIQQFIHSERFNREIHNRNMTYTIFQPTDHTGVIFHIKYTSQGLNVSEMYEIVTSDYIDSLDQDEREETVFTKIDDKCVIHHGLIKQV